MDQQVNHSVGVPRADAARCSAVAAGGIAAKSRAAGGSVTPAGGEHHQEHLILLLARPAAAAAEPRRAERQPAVIFLSPAAAERPPSAAEAGGGRRRAQVAVEMPPPVDWGGASVGHDRPSPARARKPGAGSSRVTEQSTEGQCRLQRSTKVPPLRCARRRVCACNVPGVVPCAKWPARRYRWR